MLVARIIILLVVLIIIWGIFKIAKKSIKKSEIVDPIDAKNDTMDMTIDAAKKVDEKKFKAFKKAKNKINSEGDK